MTAPTNTVTSLNNVGAREDLEGMIYLVAPQETPMVSAIDKTKAKAVRHDWQTEGLAAPNASNAQLEGDDVVTFDAANYSVRVENYCQIFRKTVVISRTEDVVALAGRDKETARQTVLKMRELKRDIELSFCSNKASNAESGSTARNSAGMLAFIATNSSSGTGGSAGGYSAGIVAAATNGTQRSLTETLFKAGMASVFNAGGKPSVALMGGTLKQEFSAFTGIAEIRKDAPASPKMATIVGAADIYVSDFGTISLVPHPYAFSRDLACIDPDMWAVGVLDGTKTTPLAKTGDSNKLLMVNESCLVARNEASSFAIRDLQ
jgi:hypothetical protein